MPPFNVSLSAFSASQTSVDPVDTGDAPALQLQGNLSADQGSAPVEATDIADAPARADAIAELPPVPEQFNAFLLAEQPAEEPAPDNPPAETPSAPLFEANESIAQGARATLPPSDIAPSEPTPPAPLSPPEVIVRGLGPALEAGLRDGRTRPFLGLTRKQNPLIAGDTAREPLGEVIDRFFLYQEPPLRNLRSIPPELFTRADELSTSLVEPVKGLSKYFGPLPNDIDELLNRAALTVEDRNKIVGAALRALSPGTANDQPPPQRVRALVFQAAAQLRNEGNQGLLGPSAFSYDFLRSNRDVLERVIKNASTPEPTLAKAVSSILRAGRVLRVARILGPLSFLATAFDAGYRIKDSSDKDRREGGFGNTGIELTRLAGGLAGAYVLGSLATAAAAAVALGPVSLFLGVGAAGILGAAAGDAVAKQVAEALVRAVPSKSARDGEPPASARQPSA
jgi:hypothetical protein